MVDAVIDFWTSMDSTNRVWFVIAMIQALAVLVGGIAYVMDQPKGY